MTCPGRVLSDYIEVPIMKEFHELCSMKSVYDGVLLPNACRGYSGVVLKTDDVAIPSVLGGNIGMGTYMIHVRCDVGHIYLNDMIIRNALLELQTDGLRFIEIGFTSSNDIYIVVRCGSGKYGLDVSKKYEYLLRKIKGIGGYRNGTRGYDEYFSDYNYVVDIAHGKRKHVASSAVDLLSSICDVEVVSMKEFHTHTISTDDNGTFYRVNACKSDGVSVGVVLGNMRDGNYICATKSIRSMLYSYPSTLGLSISNPMAKDRMNIQTLNIESNGVGTWVDERFERDEAPYNYKSIETIREDSNGAIYSCHRIIPILNVRW